MTLNAVSFATFCHSLPVTLSQFLLGVIFGNEQIVASKAFKIVTR